MRVVFHGALFCCSENSVDWTALVLCVISVIRVELTSSGVQRCHSPFLTVKSCCSLFLGQRVSFI